MATAQETSSYQDATLGTGLRATFIELGRVVWPTRQELFRMTGVVITTVIAIAGFIGLVDVVLTRATEVLYGTGT